MTYKSCLLIACAVALARPPEFVVGAQPRSHVADVDVRRDVATGHYIVRFQVDAELKEFVFERATNIEPFIDSSLLCR